MFTIDQRMECVKRDLSGGVEITNTIGDFIEKFIPYNFHTVNYISFTSTSVSRLLYSFRLFHVFCNF